ncbi:hypothetical protein Tco_0053299 [Tanacetum coccineum]
MIRHQWEPHDFILDLRSGPCLVVQRVKNQRCISGVELKMMKDKELLRNEERRMILNQCIKKERDHDNLCLYLSSASRFIDNLWENNSGKIVVGKVLGKVVVTYLVGNMWNVCGKSVGIVCGKSVAKKRDICGNMAARNCGKSVGNSQRSEGKSVGKYLATRSDVGSEQYSANNPGFNTLGGTIHLNMASDVSINVIDSPNDPNKSRPTSLGHTSGITDVNLLKEDVGNVLVWVKFHGVPMTAFSEDGLSAIANKLGSSYARAMIELRADMELKDIIVVAMPKLVGEGHALDECPKKIVSDVVKNLKNPKQAAKGVQVGPKVGFKPIKQVYRHVSYKNSVSTSAKKKKAEFSRQERNSKSAGKGLLTVAPSSSSTIHIAERIDKLERQILDEKLMFVHDDGKPLYKADSTVNVDNDGEMEEVYNETVVFFGINKFKKWQ